MSPISARCTLEIFDTVLKFLLTCFISFTKKRKKKLLLQYRTKTETKNNKILIYLFIYSSDLGELLNYLYVQDTT